MATADVTSAQMSDPRTIGAPRRLRTLRTLFLVGIALNLALIGLQVLLYPALLAQPGSLGYIAEPIVLLLAYAGIAYAATTRATSQIAPSRLATLRLATSFGLLSGALWIVNHTLETFADTSGWGVLASAPFLLGAFVLWGVAGMLRTWQTGVLRSGLLAAIWSAMLCVLLTITYGFALLSLAFLRLQALETNDPDFLRSRWSDPLAFTIANTFDAAFSHLLGALVISLIVGGAGSLLGLLAYRLRAAQRDVAR